MLVQPGLCECGLQQVLLHDGWPDHLQCNVFGAACGELGNGTAIITDDDSQFHLSKCPFKLSCPIRVNSFWLNFDKTFVVNTQVLQFKFNIFQF